jgi:hypothetical protein
MASKRFVDTEISSARVHSLLEICEAGKNTIARLARLVDIAAALLVSQAPGGGRVQWGAFGAKYKRSQFAKLFLHLFASY